jgi:enoyl-CoA hydratase/carnithine racemase
MEWSRELADRSPGGVALAKSASNFWWDLSYPAMTSALATMEAGLSDPTVAEGVAAFFEKRSPVWPP